MAYCPSCISFKEECNPEPEDYNKPCEYYKDAEEELKEHQRGGLAHPHEFIKKKRG